MAWATEADTPHLLTSMTHDGATLKGALGCVIRKIVERAARRANGNISPVSAPVSRLDAEAVCRFSDHSGGISHTASSGSIVANFSGGDGGAGSVTIGPMVAGSIVHTFERSPEGMPVEQTFQLEGSALTYSVSI